MPRRKAPKWCYWRGEVLWVRFTVNGVEIRESLGTSSIEVARARAESARKREVGRARHGEIVHTWEDALAGWADHIANAVGARTADRYLQSIRMVSRFFTEMPVADIGSKEVGAMILARQRQVTNTKRPPSIATIRRDLTAVASVLDYAIEQDWREGNPARERARRLKERRDAITLPSSEDIEQVLAPLKGGMEDIARFAWATGMRLNEIVSLDRRRIRGDKIFIVKAKGNKKRTIELDPMALAIIARQPISMKSSLVFHHDGERYSCISTNFGDAVDTAQKTAQKAERDFTRFRFHDLRHVFAVTALRSGRMGIYDLSIYLGHTSVKTTEIYLQFLTPEEARQAKHGTIGGTEAAVSGVSG